MFPYSSSEEDEPEAQSQTRRQRIHASSRYSLSRAGLATRRPFNPPTRQDGYATSTGFVRDLQGPRQQQQRDAVATQQAQRRSLVFERATLPQSTQARQQAPLRGSRPTSQLIADLRDDVPLASASGEYARVAGVTAATKVVSLVAGGVIDVDDAQQTPPPPPCPRLHPCAARMVRFRSPAAHQASSSSSSSSSSLPVAVRRPPLRRSTLPLALDVFHGSLSDDDMDVEEPVRYPGATQQSDDHVTPPTSPINTPFFPPTPPPRLPYGRWADTLLRQSPSPSPEHGQSSQPTLGTAHEHGHPHAITTGLTFRRSSSPPARRALSAPPRLAYLVPSPPRPVARPAVYVPPYIEGQDDERINELIRHTYERYGELDGGRTSDEEEENPIEAMMRQMREASEAARRAELQTLLRRRADRARREDEEARKNEHPLAASWREMVRKDREDARRYREQVEDEERQLWAGRSHR